MLGIALALAGCGKPAARPPEKSLVRTAAVQSMSDVRSNGDASYLAQVKFDHETDLSFKVGGIVVSIGPAVGTDWDEATPVKAGTVLAELKQADFTNALNSARARADLMVKQLERFRKLRVTDAISQQELDVTEADWRTAQSQLDQAEQNLRDSRLVAAKDGVVLARYINSRVTVSSGQRVLRFADTSLMSVELGLPDRLVGRLTPGKEIPVEVSALEGMPPFRGRVSEVGVAATSEGRLFRVVIKVPNPDGLLRSGMTARIRVERRVDRVEHGVHSALGAGDASAGWALARQRSGAVGRVCRSGRQSDPARREDRRHFQQLDSRHRRIARGRTGCDCGSEFPLRRRAGRSRVANDGCEVSREKERDICMSNPVENVNGKPAQGSTGDSPNGTGETIQVDQGGRSATPQSPGSGRRVAERGGRVARATPLARSRREKS